MQHATRRGSGQVACLVLICGMVSLSAGCSVAPKVDDRAAFMAKARSATTWFEENVDGLKDQIRASAGYIVFPGVAQWGTGWSGGRYGRGVLNNASGSQIGWSSLNSSSLGLEVGGQGFKMLMVVKDDATLDLVKKSSLTGSVSSVAVIGRSGASSTASFEKGLAIYQGGNAGLMAGVNIGLELLRYAPRDD